MRGAIHQKNATTRMRPAVPGVVADSSQDNERDVLINRDPDAAEVFTLVIDTATDDEDYGVNLLDPSIVSVIIDSGTGSSVASIAAALAAEWNITPQARGIAAATVVTDTITFTGVFAGVVFDLEEDENSGKMTLANVTNATEADPVPFGRALISLAFLSDEPSQLGILAKTTAFTAQVDTFTVTFEALELYEITIVVNEQPFTVTVLADTNDNDTATAIRLALNARMPANTVIITGATDQVILTAELAGLGFKTSFGLTVSPDVNLVLVNTTGGIASDFDLAFAGISEFSYDTQQLTIGTESAEYAANAGVSVLKRGPIWVENSESPALKDAVFVELAAGDDTGKFFAAASATRVRVNSKLLTWKRPAHGASGAWDASDANVAVLGISLAA